MQRSPRRLLIPLALILSGAVSPLWAQAPAAGSDPWTRVPAILKRIVPPSFPQRDFPLTKYGGVGDGTTDCTDGFRRAIEACHTGGGGRVVVPPGQFVTGAIHLKSG